MNNYNEYFTNQEPNTEPTTVPTQETETGYVQEVATVPVTEPPKVIEEVKEKKPMNTKSKLLIIFIILCFVIAGSVLFLMWYESQDTQEKNKTYSQTIISIMNSAKAMVEEQTPDSSEKYNNPDTTYFIPVNCIKGQESTKSPFGKLDHAYVVTAYEEDKNVYYFYGWDEKGNGFSEFTSLNDIKEDNIRSKNKDINFEKGIGARTRVITYNENCKAVEQFSYRTAVSKAVKGDYDNKKAIKFSAVRNIYPEYNVEAVGIYYSSNAGLGYYTDDSVDLTKVESFDVKDKLIKNTTGNVGVRFAQSPTNVGEYSLVYSVIKPTDVIYALPFVEAKDKNGKSYLFYGPVYSTTYQQVISNN